MPVRITVPPTVEPVTLSELKAHLRIDDGAEDAVLDSLITAARQHVEHLTRRQLITATLLLTLDRFPENNGRIELPYPPLQEVSSIAYTDTAGAPQTLAKALYAVDTERAPGRVVPAYGEDWPSTRETINAVSVTYKAGYGAAGSSVPQALRHAILLLAGHWYEHREAVSERPSLEETPQALAALVSQYQVDIYPVNAG